MALTSSVFVIYALVSVILRSALPVDRLLTVGFVYQRYLMVFCSSTRPIDIGPILYDT